MTVWERVKSAMARGVKQAQALTAMVFRRYANTFWGRGVLPRSRFDFLSEVGDGTGSSTVMAPLLWILRTFPEAPPALYQQEEGGEEKQVHKHPVLELMQRPNPFYTGPLLWMATLADYNVDGNGYWLKLRNRIGIVKQLWWAPTWSMCPKGDETTFITHYEYTVNGQILELRPEDVIHFRFGMDGDDPRRGFSPLKSVLREVFTDDEAANFTAALLKNMGVPGLMVSPEGDTQPSAEDVIAVKAYLKGAFTGDNRGDPLVMSGATKVQQFGFSPEQLLLRELRRIPEERVSGVLGVPAIVAGLGAGLERSTFTNMGEAREMAYESNIIPSQRLLAEDVRFGLLAEFVDDVFSWRFGFDLSKVRVLQEDLYRQALRLDIGVRGGWVQRAEARRPLGLVVSESDAVYLVPLNTAEVPADGGDARVLSPAAATGNGKSEKHSRDELERAVAEILERRELTA